MYPILIVDDEKPIADLIEMALQTMNYECVKAYSGEQAADLIDRQKFDLILLDVMLPGVDGFSLMDYIAPTGTPVIYLTAKASVEDRIRGIKAGAYDYIVKPFSPNELVARVDGLMRHTGRRQDVICVWDIQINPETHGVIQNGKELNLTRIEYDLLMTLVHNKGNVLYRDVLFERVWGMYSTSSSRTLDIHISRLRKKLGWEKQIRAVPKIGYMLEAEK